MKERKKKSKKEKELPVKDFKHKHRGGWEIVQLPNGDFQWIVKRGA